jgi:indole-3-glycerol phosphate synthase
MDILEEIIAHKRVEIDQRKQYVSPQRLYGLVEALIMNEQQAPASMRQALLDSPTGIIAEFKRRSPSKGWIRREGKADIIPSATAEWASALSILTDTDYFGGYDEFVQQLDSRALQYLYYIRTSLSMSTSCSRLVSVGNAVLSLRPT